MTPRGRFAPSPSGFMHLGNAWTALLAWLDIRKRNGTMILRMEDLDPDRSKKEFADAILSDLKWLGLDWDEGPDKEGDYGPYRQSERSEFYEAVFEKLLKQEKVYPCYCSRAELRNAAFAPHVGETEYPYSGRCRNMALERKQHPAEGGRLPAFRLKVDSAEIVFYDEIYGLQKQRLEEVCGDFVIRRADGVFAYQLAVVIDDADMQVSRVVRGADLLNSTPRQIYLWKLLGKTPPYYLHVPLLVSSDGTRLSKRHGSLTLKALRSSGVKPEEVIGKLAFWAGLIKKPESIRALELISVFNANGLPKDAVVVADNMI